MALNKEEKKLLVQIDLHVTQLLNRDIDKEARIRSLEKRVWATMGSSLLIALTAIITALLN